VKFIYNIEQYFSTLQNTQNNAIFLQ